jgi:geranyl-CoA carboxylase alpha subunit
MLAKVIAHGATRDEARRRLTRALEQTALFGPRHNKRYVRDVLQDSIFAAGEATTRFVDQRAELLTQEDSPALCARAWAAAALLWTTGDPATSRPSDGWRSSADALAFPLDLRARGRGDQPDRDLTLTLTCAGSAALEIGGLPEREQSMHARVIERDGLRARLELDGLQETVTALRHEDTLFIDIRGVEFRFTERLPAGANDERADDEDGVIRARATGRVVALHVQEGEHVERGQALIVVESMKIQQTYTATITGVIKTLTIAIDDQVAQRGPLMTIEAHE